MRRRVRGGGGGEEEGRRGGREGGKEMETNEDYKRIEDNVGGREYTVATATPTFHACTYALTYLSLKGNVSLRDLFSESHTASGRPTQQKGGRG